MKKFIISLSLFFVAAFSFVFFNTHDTKAATLDTDFTNIYNGYIVGFNKADLITLYQGNTISAADLEVYMTIFDYNTYTTDGIAESSTSIVGVPIGELQFYLDKTYYFYYFDIRFLPQLDYLYNSGINYRVLFGLVADGNYYPSIDFYADYDEYVLSFVYDYYSFPFYISYLTRSNVFLFDFYNSSYWLLISNSVNNSDLYDLYYQYVSSYYYFAIDNSNQQYNIGYSAGYSNGSTIGYNNGYQDGLQNSSLADFQDGYNTAYDAFYQSRYDLGFTAGVQQGRSQNDWLAVGLLSLVDIPFITFRQIFNFDLFGFNLYSIILALATIGLILWLFKKFFKKE